MSRLTETLTFTPYGHTLHHNSVFSTDGNWIVFDTRNDDTQIGSTNRIGKVHINTAEEIILYTVSNANEFGPGVGAASVNALTDDVIFIHGLDNANQKRPYAMTRRTGVGFNLNTPQEIINYDARDCTPPFVEGSLSGGTHSHAWNCSQNLISFTYNDELKDADLRKVGVMFKHHTSILVDDHPENRNGTWSAKIVTDVVAEPVWGSDEICKAFDECWLGSFSIIVFQGNVINELGETITEVFSVDVSGEFKQKRITQSNKGLSKIRHWLRSSSDGKSIFALADNQIVRIDYETGLISTLTNLEHGVNNPFNVLNDEICFVSNNEIQVLNLKNNNVEIWTNVSNEGEIVGAPSFIPDGSGIIFNQYLLHEDGGNYLQIRKVKR